MFFIPICKTKIRSLDRSFSRIFKIKMKEAPLAVTELSGRIDPLNRFVRGIKNNSSFYQLRHLWSQLPSASSSISCFLFPFVKLKSVQEIDPFPEISKLKWKRPYLLWQNCPEGSIHWTDLSGVWETTAASTSFLVYLHSFLQLPRAFRVFYSHVESVQWIDPFQNFGGKHELPSPCCWQICADGSIQCTDLPVE